MICIVLHCDVDGCDCEQGYSIATLKAARVDAADKLYLVAVRFGAMYGWRYVDGLVSCPDHSGEGRHD